MEIKNAEKLLTNEQTFGIIKSRVFKRVATERNTDVL